MTDLSSLRLVIMSTGRSGSGWIAKVLTACGVPCGHESVFTVDGLKPPGSLLADSSWCAIGHLRDIPENCKIVHVVRNPLSVVRSFCGGAGTFLLPGNPSPYSQLRRRLFRNLHSSNSQIAAVQVWLWWNEVLGQNTRVRVVLEKIAPGNIQAIASLADVQVAHKDAAATLQTIPVTYNKHPSADRIQWSDIPDCWWKKQAELLATTYGYRCEAPPQ